MAVFCHWEALLAGTVTERRVWYQDNGHDTGTEEGGGSFKGSKEKATGSQRKETLVM